MPQAIRIIDSVAEMKDWDQSSFSDGEMAAWDSTTGKFIGSGNFSIDGSLTSSGIASFDKTRTSATNFETLTVDSLTDATTYRIGSRIGSVGGTNRNINFGQYNALGIWKSSLFIDSTNNRIGIGENNTSIVVALDIKTPYTGTYGPDLTTGLVVIASSYLYGSGPGPQGAGYGAYNAFNNVPGTLDDNCWGTNQWETDSWIGVIFNSSTVITKITIINGTPQSGRSVDKAKLEGSNDGTTWTKIPATGFINGPVVFNVDEIDFTSSTSQLQSVTFTNLIGYLRYRLFCYSTGTYKAINEIQMMGSASESIYQSMYCGLKFGIGTDSPTSHFHLVQPVSDSETITAFKIDGAANTSCLASTEAVDVNFNLARIVNFATGNIANQRAIRIQGPTYSFVAASTITTASTLSISGSPVAGTNATITNRYALNVESGTSQFSGQVRASSFCVGTGDGSDLVLIPASSTTQLFNIRFSSTTLFSFGRQNNAAFVIYNGGGVSNHLGFAGNVDSSEGVADLRIYRDSSNTFAQRNSTNSQTFRLYNTFTSATNFENLQFRAVAAGAYQIGSAIGSAGGTGRAITFGHWNSSAVFSGTAGITSGGRFSDNNGTSDGERFGADTTVSGESVAFGRYATAGADYSTAIGKSSYAGYFCTSLGRVAGTPGTSGGFPSANGFSHCITIGDGSDFFAPTASFQFFVAGLYNEAFFGKRIVGESPTASIRMQGCGGSGTNIAGTSIKWAPGKSTGNATPAKYTIQRTVALSSGTTAQSLTDALEIDGNTTAGETPMLLLDITDGTMKRVSIGTADSGGVGFKVLRVPN